MDPVDLEFRLNRRGPFIPTPQGLLPQLGRINSLGCCNNQGWNHPELPFFHLVLAVAYQLRPQLRLSSLAPICGLFYSRAS